MEAVKVKEEVTSELSVTALTDIKIKTEFNIFEQQVTEEDTNDPDIKYGTIGNDDIYIKREPLISEELHIENKDNGRTAEQAFKGFPQGTRDKCTVCDYRKKCLGLPIKAEIPDIKYGIGDDDIYIKLEPLISEELHIKHEDDASAIDQEYRSSPHSKHGMEEVKVNEEVTGELSLTVTDQKGPLERHSFTHTKEKPFTCAICDYKCGHKSILKRHILTHSGEKPFTCGRCDYKCGIKSNLKQHLLIHTGEKPFTCDRCDYKCGQKISLKQHLLTHTGEKPFTCGRCDYKCGLKGTLKRHILTHTGEKPFTCSRCDFKCTQKSNLKRHILIHS